MDFEITYISNSGFLLETGEYIFVIDYQGDHPEIVNGALLAKGKKIILMASHAHADHFSPKILDCAGKPDCAVLLSSDINAKDAVFIRESEIKDVLGVSIEAYGSTDMGVSFLINLGGKRVFHAGDLNFWHWMDESTQDEIAQAKEMFEKIIASIKKPVDLAFFPVDPRLGTSYDLGADIFLETFRPKLFVPMHFRGSTFAAIDFAAKHSGDQTQIIPLTKAGEKYGGSL